MLARRMCGVAEGSDNTAKLGMLLDSHEEPTTSSEEERRHERRRWPKWIPSPRGRWTEWRASTLCGCGTGAPSYWAGSPHSTIGDTRWCWERCARMVDALRGWTRRTQLCERALFVCNLTYSVVPVDGRCYSVFC